MSIQAHRVRRQRWSIRAETYEQALAVRHWLRENVTGPVNDALAAAFDAAAPGNDIVRVDRIEVTLRVCRIEDLLDSLPARVADALGARMVHRDVSRAVSAEDDDATLLEYVLTGRVPWPSRPDDRQLVSSLAARARASGPGIVTAIAQRAPEAATFGDAMFRLLQLVDESQWGPLLDTAARESPWLAPSAPPPALTAGFAPASRDRRLRLVVSRVSGARRDGAEAVAGPTDAAGEHTSGAGGSTTSRPPSRFAAESTQDLVEARVAHLRGAPSVARAPVTPRPLSDSEPIARADFATAVPHAGLVLIHPFLPQFFRAAGFAPGNHWDPSLPATARAAALLHFAATGDDEPYEFQLGTIKLLLGLTPEMPLPVAGGLLTDADRDEAQGMLTAVVEHWQALKRSSVAALRTSFLCRPGLVGRDENGWRLHVEPASVDVLLARIPWSLSLVKLPWMPLPIHVDWTIR